VAILHRRTVRLDRKEQQNVFCIANKFADPFEGAVAVQTGEFPVDPRYAEMERSEKAFFKLKRLTKLNCWHRAEYESDAMWRLYSGERKGVPSAPGARTVRLRTVLAVS
jgi:hypothetical protein